MGYLTIKNLKKKYGDFTAVSDINIDLEKGEMVALLGGSGCGKTTILRMIAGFIEPNEGTIEIDGRVMNKIPSYKRNVGIFFQNYALFPHMNVADNIGYGLKIRKVPKADIKKKVKEMLELVQLEGFEKRKPAELSGGQKQRVAVAVSMICGKDLLVFDEPTSGLDFDSMAQVAGLIKRLSEQGKIIFIVTHDFEFVCRTCSRVLHFDEGEMPDDIPVVMDFLPKIRELFSVSGGKEM